MSRGAWFVAAVLVVSGCSAGDATSTGSGASPSIQITKSNFTIDLPDQLIVVSVSPIEVHGRAPAGARVVEDIPFAPDKQTIAGPDGRWSIVAELKQGAQTLVFRIGDDPDTERPLRVVLDASKSPTPLSTGAP